MKLWLLINYSAALVILQYLFITISARENGQIIQNYEFVNTKMVRVHCISFVGATKQSFCIVLCSKARKVYACLPQVPFLISNEQK